MADSDAPGGPPPPMPPRPAKLPYRRPKLAHLGSVRELTLGAGGSAGEAVGMMAM
jgi:hypothetical protein